MALGEAMRQTRARYPELHQRGVAPRHRLCRQRMPPLACSAHGTRAAASCYHSKVKHGAPDRPAKQNMEETMAEGKSRVDVGRRQFLGGAGVAGAAAAAAHALDSRRSRQRADAGAGRAPPSAQPQPAGYTFFKPQEVLFIEAVVDHMVPKDELTPSGTDIGIATYIDRALAGSWGKGDRLYMQGPWQRGHRQPGLPASADAGRALSRRHRGRQRPLPQGLRADLRPLHGRAEGNVPARALRRQDHAAGRPARPRLLQRRSMRT